MPFLDYDQLSLEAVSELSDDIEALRQSLRYACAASLIVMQESREVSKS